MNKTYNYDGNHYNFLKPVERLFNVELNKLHTTQERSYKFGACKSRYRNR